MATLQDALALVKRGVPVFPLRPGTKDGYVNDASDHGATADPLTIYEWFRPGGQFAGFNFGCWTSGRWVIVDIDAGHGGLEAWAALQKELGPVQPTFTVRSGRGGLHLYFYNPSHELFSSADLVKGKINVRGTNGYVVGPGSYFHDPLTGETHPPYTIIDASDIAPVPETLCARLRRRSDDTQAGQIVSELDTPEAIKQVRDRLQWARPAIQGQSGDQTTYDLACAVLDFGVTNDTAHALMLEIWNPKCDPPWDSRELKVKVDNAWAYKQSGIGRDNPSDGFAPVPPELLKAVTTVVDASADVAPGDPPPFDWVDDLPSDAQVSWLVDEVIPEASAGFLARDSSTGKTFQALRLAQCVAYGALYSGRTIALRGGTVFLAAEGAFSIPGRIQASTEYCFRKMDLPPGVDVNRRPIIREKDCPDLLSEQGCARFIERLKKMNEMMRQRYGVPLRLLIIDTFAAAFRLADENNASEITRATNAMRRIASTLSIVVLATHHYGKDKTKGMRGNSALRANADFVLSIPSQGKLHLEKCREAAEGPLGSFTLPIVTLGTRDNGKPITSRYVEWLQLPALPNAGAGFTGLKAVSDDGSRKRSKDTATLSAAFEAIARDGPEALKATVRTEFYRMRQGNDATKRKAFGRALEAARELGHFEIANRDGHEFLIRSPGNNFPITRDA